MEEAPRIEQLMRTCCVLEPGVLRGLQVNTGRTKLEMSNKPLPKKLGER